MLCHHTFSFLSLTCRFLESQDHRLVYYYNHLCSEHSASYNDHAYMIKGGKRGRKKGGERRREKEKEDDKGKGKQRRAHF